MQLMTAATGANAPSSLPIGTIQAEHLWKRFRADLTQPMLRDTLARVRNRVRKRENPWTWVLRDVDIQVQPGEAVGLIGINGSGKSTLLKVLSRVMYPNSGRVGLNGRIGALIEVRAGIHPDLTGRENVFFYGTILGLSRRQVAERFDTIVEFAELTDAVDRQVKFYSSGMGMRLGFSIAAFLEPDILLVDEVLAVGDIDFQQRCLERMREVRRSGTTVVFVSHDMASVEAMCQRALWMDRGVVAADGPTQKVVHAYRVGLEEKAREWSTELDDTVTVLSASAYDTYGAPRPVAGGRVTIELQLKSESDEKVALCLGVTEGPGLPIFTVNADLVIPAGESRHRCTVTALPVPRGRYYIWAGAFSSDRKPPMSWHPVGFFDVDGAERDRSNGILLLSPVWVETAWDAE
jgi:ABC-type polysaccharide/polyol phosphate transport system ATPase subunit